jgi:hypothetical protein
VGPFVTRLISSICAFIVYEGHTASGKSFRNCEVHTVRDSKLIAKEVYFGWDLPHKVRKGSHIENEGQLAEQGIRRLPTSAFVKGFGCRLIATGVAGTGAGVRKPPGKMLWGVELGGGGHQAAAVYEPPELLHVQAERPQPIPVAL